MPGPPGADEYAACDLVHAAPTPRPSGLRDLRLD